MMLGIYNIFPSPLLKSSNHSGFLFSLMHSMKQLIPTRVVKQYRKLDSDQALQIAPWTKKISSTSDIILTVQKYAPFTTITATLPILVQSRA